MKSKLLLALLLATALFIRLYRLDSVPPSTYWDETAIGYDAYAIAQTAKDMHGNHWLQAMYPSYGDFKAPVYIWLTALTTKILGPSPLSVRLASVLAGIGIIFLSHLLLNRWFNSKAAGLIGAFTLTFLPYGIHFSRIGFEAHLGVFLLLFGLYFMEISKKKPVFLLPATLIGSLGVYSYFSLRIVWPLMFLSFIAVLYKQFKTKKHLPFIILSVVLFTLSLIPLFSSPYYEASNQYRFSTDSLLSTSEHILESNRLRELAGNTFISRVIYHRHILWIRLLVQNIFTHFSPDYLVFTGDPNLRHGTGFTGLIYPVLLPLFFTGWIYLLRRKTKYGIFLSLFYLIAILPAAIPLEVPHALRSLNTLPVIGMVTALGIWRLISWKHRFARVLIGLFGILLFISFGTYWHDYLKHYPSRSSASWQYPQKQLALKLDIYDDAYDEIIVDNSDYITFMYLLFYQQVDPELVRGNFDNWKANKWGKYQLQDVQIDDILQSDADTLLAVKPEFSDTIPSSITIIDIVENFTGEPAYYLVENHSNAQ